MDTATATKELAALKPLPKPHASWWFAADDATKDPAKKFPMWLAENRPLVKEIVRILGSVPISADWQTGTVLDALQQDFAQAAVTICSTPFRASQQQKTPANKLGEPWRKDVDDLLASFSKCAALAPRVNFVLFDIEHWYTTRDNPAAMRLHFDLAYHAAKTFFPTAQVSFYAHGAVQWINSNDVWVPAPYVPLDAAGDLYNCSMYYSELALNHECFRRSLAYAGNKKPMAVWVSLAASYQPCWSAKQSFKPGGVGLDRAWRYGFELNHPSMAKLAPEVVQNRFPLSQAAAVFFSPCIGSHKEPGSLDEFVAYVKGAHYIPLEN